MQGWREIVRKEAEIPKLKMKWRRGSFFFFIKLEEKEIVLTI